MGDGRRHPHLIFLYGPPAVGKLTVAKLLRERLGYRILHNHVAIDAVSQVLEFGTTAFWQSVGRLRRDLVESGAREGIDLVYTCVFAAGDEPSVEHAVATFEAVGGSVSFVRLVAPPEELMRRVADEGRKAYGKITSPEALERLFEAYDVFDAIAGRDGLTLDVATMPASDAADLIAEYVERGAG